MKIIKRLLLILIIMMLCGCQNVKQYTAAYTIYPLEYLLNRIGGNKISKISIQNNDLVEVARINGDYREILEDSSYLFHIGNLEPYFDLYESEIEETGVTSIDLSSLNAIYRFQRYTMVYVDKTESFIESPYYEGDAMGNIDTYDLDLFLWLDPIGMLSMAKDIYSTLASNIVEESSYFRSNYETLENDLIALDAAYQNLASKIKNQNMTIKFVSMTPSFGSWQKAYGFGVYPVCLSRYGALPNDEQLAIIKKRIVDDGVEYIAYEPNISDEMLKLFLELESELGLKRVNLNNISSLTVTQLTDNKDYLSLMYENLSVLENMATRSLEASNEALEVEDEVIVD